MSHEVLAGKVKLARVKATVKFSKFPSSSCTLNTDLPHVVNSLTYDP